ncbi:MAG TPA: hypothetical protein VFY45_11970 [Baekduia sp.]|nr:hypothetical protein [Baekduia sp.]
MWILVAAILATCALTAPSTGSAASWSPVGTTHTLDATTFSFFAGAGITAGALCATARFHTHVRSSTVLTITGASFSGCVATGTISACSVLFTATHFPWSATAISENNLRIDDVHLGVVFTGASCPLPTNSTVTGSIGGAVPGTSTWDFFSHTMTFNNATGLTTHLPGIGTIPTTVTSGLRDTSQTLTIT